MRRVLNDLKIMILANLWIVPVVAGLVWALFQFVAPPPPMSASMATGTQGGAYQQFAERLKEELTKETLRAARNAMKELKSDEGRPLGIKPTILLVGNSNSDRARDLLLAERDANGATNTDRNLLEIVESPFLD